MPYRTALRAEQIPPLPPSVASQLIYFIFIYINIYTLCYRNMVPSFLYKCISWITVYEPFWAQEPLRFQLQCTWGGSSAKEYSSSPQQEARQGRFGFSAEFCLTNSEARVSLMLVSLPGSTQGPEGDSDAPIVITELPRPPGKNSKHQSALIFAGSPVTSMQFQRDQKESFCRRNPA